MILSVHMLAGAAVGSQIHNYWLVSIVSLVLHFILDKLPHWEYHAGFRSEHFQQLPKRKALIFAVKVFLDFAIGIFLVVFFWQNSPNFSSIALGSFFCVLPDGFLFLHMFFKIVFRREPALIKKIYNFHHANHYPANKNPRFWGVLVEGAVVAISLFLLLI